MRILLIEQDASMQRVLALALTALGHEVETVGDADEAAFSLNFRWPDLMLAPLSPTGPREESVCRRIQSLFNEIPPTIVVSAGPLDFRQRREIAGSILLNAPFTVEELQRAIRRARAMVDLERLEVPEVGYC